MLLVSRETHDIYPGLGGPCDFVGCHANLILTRGQRRSHNLIQETNCYHLNLFWLQFPISAMLVRPIAPFDCGERITIGDADVGRKAMVGDYDIPTWTNWENNAIAIAGVLNGIGEDEIRREGIATRNRITQIPH
jgi:hypothetical protein